MKFQDNNLSSSIKFELEREEPAFSFPLDEDTISFGILLLI
jgi:hypothetical protein